MESRVYRFRKSSLTVVFDRLENSLAEVIVSSDDTSLSMEGGVSRCILNAAGESLLTDVAKCVPVSLSDVVVTTAGALPARYIFHVATVDYKRDVELFSVDYAVGRCFALLNVLELKSIAFPALGTGAAMNDIRQVAVLMVQAVVKYIEQFDMEVDVEIYLYDRFGDNGRMAYIDFFEQLAIKTGGEAVLEELQKSSRSQTLRADLGRQLSVLARELNVVEEQLHNLSGGDANREALKDRLSSIMDERFELRKRLSPKSPGLPVKLFISYAHADKKCQSAFVEHLSALKVSGLIDLWSDVSLTPGVEWDNTIRSRLNEANVIVLLISASFLNSEFCTGVEMHRALERHDNGEALVIPVLVGPVAAWEELPFAKLQTLPKRGKDLSSSKNKALFWVDVVTSVKEAIEAYFPAVYGKNIEK